jgi:DAK2 domain fusion protein YloV
VDELEALNSDAVCRWARLAACTLNAHRAEIDHINVFPVADRDTGSNLAVTLQAAAEALEREPPTSAADALRVFARAALVGARGNSGVIVSQLLRGLADAAPGSWGAAGAGPYGAAELRDGLRIGVNYAYAAVAEPVEGTVLTVIRAAADGLPLAPTDLEALVRAAVREAETALGRTPRQLEALARAGVVDAGGQGLVLVLDALAVAVCGQSAATAGGEHDAHDAHDAQRHRHRAAVRESGSSDFEYEVQYLLDAPATATGGLRDGLSALGDSVVIAGSGDGTWNIHAHVNDVGAAIEAGVSSGTVRAINVARFDPPFTGSAGSAAASDNDAGGADPDAGTPTAVLAMAPGTGLAHLFVREGIRVVGESDEPLTVAGVLRAIEAAGSTQVIVLSNGASDAALAETAAVQARRQGVRVALVPTRSPVQGLAAVAVHDVGRGFDDDVVAMAEAAAATRFAEVVVAGEQSLTSVGICQAGDVLGLIDGDVVEIGAVPLAVADALLVRLSGVGAELMTLLVGERAPTGAGEQLAQRVRELAPLTEVTVYLGTPDDALLVIGVE